MYVSHKYSRFSTTPISKSILPIIFLNVSLWSLDMSSPQRSRLLWNITTTIFCCAFSIGKISTKTMQSLDLVNSVNVLRYTLCVEEISTKHTQIPSQKLLNKFANSSFKWMLVTLLCVTYSSLPASTICFQNFCKS